eukprot:4018897-Prymnesium_polylepis.1
MSGWDNLEGNNKRTGERVAENAKLRHPGHLGRDHVGSGLWPIPCPGQVCPGLPRSAGSAGLP